MRKVDKIEIVDTALAGQRPGQIPFSIWHHFPPEAHAGKECAEAHLAHYRRYDLDYIKVMNDNPYDMPETMPVVMLAKDWLHLEPLDKNAPGFRAELAAVVELTRAIGAEARFAVTVFNPLAYAMKISDMQAIKHLREDPEAVEYGLGVIAESLKVLSKMVVEAGASGIFLACSGPDPSMLSEEEYHRFAKPRDVEVLTAVKDAPFNMLHVHGTDVYLELFLDYPTRTLNWPAHHSAYPIDRVRRLTDKCLIAGVDERGPIVEGKMRATIAQVSEAVSRAGSSGFMVGSECTVPPDTSPEMIRAVRDLVAQM